MVPARQYAQRQLISMPLYIGHKRAATLSLLQTGALFVFLLFQLVVFFWRRSFFVKRSNMALPGKAPLILKKIVSTIVNITCNGQPISPLYGCVSDGVICSNHGTCTNNMCVCDSGYSGSLCQTNNTSGSSSTDIGTIVGIVLGMLTSSSRHRVFATQHLVSVFLASTKCQTLLPAGVVIPVIIILIIIAIVLFIFAKTRKKDETWEIGNEWWIDM